MEVLNVPWLFDLEQFVPKFASHSYFFVQKLPTTVGLFQKWVPGTARGTK
jgi:hypothetical protein